MHTIRTLGNIWLDFPHLLYDNIFYVGISNCVTFVYLHVCLYFPECMWEYEYRCRVHS